MAQTPIYNFNKKNIDDDDEESEVVLDDVDVVETDANDLFGNYKQAQNKQDDKTYVVPEEAMTKYLNKVGKTEEKKEEKKEEAQIVSRSQRPRAKPDDKKSLTIKEVAKNYQPHVSPFTKKAEEDDDESPKDLKSCQKKFTNLNNKFNTFKKVMMMKMLYSQHNFYLCKKILKPSMRILTQYVIN